MGDTRKMTAQPVQNINAILACKLVLLAYKSHKIFPFFGTSSFFFLARVLQTDMWGPF